jgi:hypothetical protein
MAVVHAYAVGVEVAGLVLEVEVVGRRPALHLRPSMEVVMNSRSPQTMGDDSPRPGTGVFQAMFLSGPHSSGSRLAAEIPRPPGPLHCGQFASARSAGAPLEPRREARRSRGGARQVTSRRAWRTGYPRPRRPLAHGGPTITSNHDAGRTMAYGTMERQQHSEGAVARTIEEQTAKLPSDTFLWMAVGAMARRPRSKSWGSATSACSSGSGHPRSSSSASTTRW